MLAAEVTAEEILEADMVDIDISGFKLYRCLTFKTVDVLRLIHLPCTAR
jgi:hypothetical protein